MKVCTSCGQEWPDETKFCPNDGSTLRAPEGASDLVDSVVADRYHITKKLGEGGMGAVYLGEHVKMGRKSAIKVISRSMASDPDAIARFNREAANAARITHPNVCSIYDFGETEDGLIYLAMEFIEGEALTDLIDREGVLSPKRAADILAQSAEALASAHDLAIVHRDLKPDNIMIAKNRDGSDLVKVVDFGIAKAVGGEEDQKVTKTGLVVGTPEYMSPEQLSGDQVDGRSDIYSLALVFFRMLTGKLPFQAESAQEIMIKRLTDEPLQLVDALPGTPFPPRLQEVMDHALQRMPGDRYSNASQFGKDSLGAVTGMADVAPSVDVDGATQLFDSSQMPGVADDLQGATALVNAEATEETAPPEPPATAQMPQTRVSSQDQLRPPTPDTPLPHAQPAPEPAGATAHKKAPVMAIAAAALVLVGGGGTAVVMMNRGDSADPPQIAGNQNVTPGTNDSVSNGTETNGQTNNGTERDPDPEPEPPRPLQTNDSATRESTATVTPPDPTNNNPAWMSLAGTAANDHLEAMFISVIEERPGLDHQAIADTARAYYDADGISVKDRAFAAYVIANSFAELDQAQSALTWARRANDLDPQRAYQRLVDDLVTRGN